MKLTAGIITDWPRHLRINIRSALWHWQVKFWRFHISCYEGKTNIIPFGSCNKELESGIPHSTCTCILIAPLKWSTQEAIFKGIGYLIPPKTNLEVSELVSMILQVEHVEGYNLRCCTPHRDTFEFKFDNFRNLQQKLAAGTMVNWTPSSGPTANRGAWDWRAIQISSHNYSTELTPETPGLRLHDTTV
jgi:hypothetical protein